MTTPPGSCLLVTGARGFVGQHVMAQARAQALTVVAAEGDLRDPRTAAGLVDTHRPSAVIHLASSWRRSSGRPWSAFADDVAMARGVLEAVTDAMPDAAILFAGSAAEYGDPGRADSIDETTPLRPVSAYGQAKAALGGCVLSDAMRLGVRVIWARSFNHIGPGQGTNAPAAQWASQIASAEQGGQRAISVGRLSSVRDFLAVQDVARAYIALATAPDALGPYNVCSGRATSLSELFELLRRAACVEVSPTPDPALLRTADPPRVVGDPSRLCAATGWRPEVALGTSASELLDAYRVAERDTGGAALSE